MTTRRPPDLYPLTPNDEAAVRRPFSESERPYCNAVCVECGYPADGRHKLGCHVGDSEGPGTRVPAGAFAMLDGEVVTLRQRAPGLNPWKDGR